MTTPGNAPKITYYTAIQVNHDQALDLPDQLVMVRVVLNDVPIAEVVVEYGYRLVAGADGVRVEKLWESPAEPPAV